VKQVLYHLSHTPTPGCKFLSSKFAAYYFSVEESYPVKEIDPV
jgi:outer membrane scaffolding protein for murein synthesis (MipA/OmpV family)